MVNSKAVGSSLIKAKKVVNGGWLGEISVLSAMGISRLPTSRVFLPAAGNRNGTSVNNVGSYGYYWSSSLDTDGPGDAWYLGFYSDDYDMGSSYRCCGRSVRPVCASQN